jgi:HK97 family phage portal protein
MIRKACRVPLKVFRREGDDPADRTLLMPGDHPVADAISAPWNRGSSVDFVQALLGPVLVHGNSATVIVQNRDSITFESKDFRFCRPIMPFRDRIAGFSFDYDQPAEMEEVSIDKVLHVKWWSPAGPIGCSPLQQLGVTVQIEDAAQRWQRAMLHQGATPQGAVSMDPTFLGLKQSEREQIISQVRRDLREIYGGPENAGKPALLAPGMTWTTIGQSPVEADLIKQRLVTREEVAAVYGIPPPLLGILDRATYSNIQTQRDMTYTDVLGPPLVMLEQTVNAQLCRDLLQEPDIMVEFDFGAVLRGDPLAEIDALRDAIGTGLFTPNEGRAFLKMKGSDVPEMDEFWMPQNNLSPVGKPPAPKVVQIPPGGLPTDAPPPNQDPEDFPGEEPVPEPQRGLARRIRVDGTLSRA